MARQLGCALCLAALLRAALDSLPAAGKLSSQERRIILDALEVVVLNWLRTVFQPEIAWEATCPKGHTQFTMVFLLGAYWDRIVSNASRSMHLANVSCGYRGQGRSRT